MDDLKEKLAEKLAVAPKMGRKKGKNAQKVPTSDGNYLIEILTDCGSKIKESIDDMEVST